MYTDTVETTQFRFNFFLLYEKEPVITGIRHTSSRIKQSISP